MHWVGRLQWCNFLCWLNALQVPQLKRVSMFPWGMSALTWSHTIQLVTWVPNRARITSANENLKISGAGAQNTSRTFNGELRIDWNLVGLNQLGVSDGQHQNTETDILWSVGIRCDGMSFVGFDSLSLPSNLYWNLQKLDLKLSFKLHYSIFYLK